MSPSSQDGLVVEANDIPIEFARAVPEEVARLDAEIAALAEQFQLPRREQSRFRWVRAVLSISIDNLEDSRAAALHAYGPVQPELAMVLDPRLRSLQDRLRKLLAALEWGTNP